MEKGRIFTRVDCDISEFETMFLNLTGKQIIAAKKKALRAGSGIIQRSTRSVMQNKGFAFRAYMRKAVAYKVNRKGYMSTIHLFGKMNAKNRKGKDVDRALMQYLNSGTKTRYGKKGSAEKYVKRRNRTRPNVTPGNHGKIKAYDFLGDGTNRGKSDAGARIVDVMEKEIIRISYLKK